jgi:hypothetical protein
MWWVIGYILGAGGMMLFVAWTALDYPLPRTKLSAIGVVLAILFWPLTAVAFFAGVVYVFADTVLFEERPDSDATSVCDQRNPLSPRECGRCGAQLSKLARYCRHCGRPVSSDQSQS